MMTAVAECNRADRADMGGAPDEILLGEQGEQNSNACPEWYDGAEFSKTFFVKAKRLQLFARERLLISRCSFGALESQFSTRRNAARRMN
jgi:hypothetical protein